MTTITAPIPHDYKIFFYREDTPTGGCIRDSYNLKAWTAQEAIFQFELLSRMRYANDRYFRVLEVEPSAPDGALEREERMRLVPQICERCRHGKGELVRDAMGIYAHRSKPGAILDNCDAHVLHKLLETQVKTYMEDDN